MNEVMAVEVMVVGAMVVEVMAVQMMWCDGVGKVRTNPFFRVIISSRVTKNLSTIMSQEIVKY